MGRAGAGIPGHFLEFWGAAMWGGWTLVSCFVFGAPPTVHPVFLKIREGSCHGDSQIRRQSWLSARVQPGQERVPRAPAHRDVGRGSGAASVQAEPPEGLGVGVHNTNSPEDPTRCEAEAGREGGWGRVPGPLSASLRGEPPAPGPRPHPAGRQAREALTELHEQVLVGRQRLLEVALVEHQDVVLLLGRSARAGQHGQGQGQAEQSAAQHVGSRDSASVGAAGQRGHESARRPPRPYKPGRRARARPRPPSIGRRIPGPAPAALGLDIDTISGPGFGRASEGSFAVARDWPRSSRSHSAPASHWLPAENFLPLDS